jgi:DNA-binding transcriptional ArsR family regulator
VNASLVFDALGDPTRRQILEALSDGPQPVGALAAQLPVRRPAVSKQLAVLVEARLVTFETEGTRHLYSLAPDGYAEAQEWFSRTWDVVLSAFGAHLEKEKS